MAEVKDLTPSLEQVEAYVNQKVRELENVRAFGKAIDFEYKNSKLESENEKLRKELEKHQALEGKMLNNLFDVAPLYSLHELEKIYVIQTLNHFGGNKTQTAEALGIMVKTLYNKLHEYGVL